LEALLPGLKRVAERVIFDARDREELWSLLLACAWEQIRTYPLERRPSRIAANLLLDTRRKTLDEFLRERARTRFRPDDMNAARRAGRGADRHRDVAVAMPSAAASSPRAQADVDALLRTAVEAGAISSDEAELIARTRIDGVALHELARAANVAYHTLNVRRIRAERRLLLFLGHAGIARSSQAGRRAASVHGG
jgi:DNA-directed RNA polymerase specialized sigma24 family protein